MTTLLCLHPAEEYNSVSGKKFRLWQLKQNIVVQRTGLLSLLCTRETQVQTSSLAPDIFTAVYGQTELQIRPRDLPHNFQLFINNAMEFQIFAVF
jgi:hypothetical protein